MAAATTPPKAAAAPAVAPLTPAMMSALMAAGWQLAIPGDAAEVLAKMTAGHGPVSLTVPVRITRCDSAPPAVAPSPPAEPVRPPIAVPRPSKPAVVASGPSKVVEPAAMAMAAMTAGANDSVAPPAAATAHPDPKTETEPEPESFDQMGLPQRLLRGVSEIGFEQPTPCQRRAIPALVAGRDVLLQAPAGTGKTGAFAIGGLGRVLSQSPPGSTILVVSPNKDLAVQTGKAFTAMLRHAHGVRVHLSYGGKHRDTAELRDKVRSGCKVVVSATPGRALQALGDRGALSPDSVALLVVDEFDTMLDRFHDEMQDITRAIPPQCQICMTSATANDDVLATARKILRNPVEFSGSNKVTPSVQQQMVDCGSADFKLAALIDLVPHAVAKGRSIVFSNSIPTIKLLAQELHTSGVPGVAMVHGEMTLADRDAVVSDFRDGTLKVLVAADAVARGFDVQQVATVFHFDVALNHAGYVHRSSRCGRQGRRGLAISLVAGRELEWLRGFEAAEGKRIEPLSESSFDLL